MKELIGKEVRIYPGDTQQKRGIILEIRPSGILFKITFAEPNDKSFTIGKKHFIAFANRLNVEEV